MQELGILLYTNTRSETTSVGASTERKKKSKLEQILEQKLEKIEISRNGSEDRE